MDDFHLVAVDEFNTLYPYRRNLHLHDEYLLAGMLESRADVAIYVDADMVAVSKDVRRIVPLARRFGLCATVSDRWMQRVEVLEGSWSDKRMDDVGGTGFSMMPGPMAFNPSHGLARSALVLARKEVRRRQSRLSPILWRAFYQTGFSPCLLPPQWCVCQNCVGIGNEIVLHAGHNKVRQHYGIDYHLLDGNLSVRRHLQ